MTREEAKQNTWRAHCNFDDPRKAIHIVIDQIFDEHEKELKQSYIDGSNSNNGLIQFYLQRLS